uniref:Uncharacterized protein n=1 Tax=Sphaerodactylus townsendi TaxID=933632 RepID=A0ACB8G2C6_9SAUR
MLTAEEFEAKDSSSRNSQGQLITVYGFSIFFRHLSNVEEPGQLLGFSSEAEPRHLLGFILMAGGGHFAEYGSLGIELMLGGEVLVVHKTFHRYTVTRSPMENYPATGVRDAQDVCPNLLGGLPCDHNGASLLKDIQEPWPSWKGHLQGAGAHLSCVPSTNRARFFVESCSDPSRGAGESETVPLNREESTEAQEWLEPQGVPSTPVEDLLFTACKTGDLKTLQHLLGMADGAAQEGEDCHSNNMHHLLNASLNESGWTLLHVAAAAGRSAVVRLLLQTGADPAIRDKQNQPPYCVSADKQTRNEFRRFMDEQPEKYDYIQAQVPGPLTSQMEAKQAERRRAHKAQRKQREKEERESQQLLKQEENEKRCFALLSDREKIHCPSHTDPCCHNL